MLAESGHDSTRSNIDHENATSLRALIAAYRARIDRGAGFGTVAFCVQAIASAERQLSEVERRAPRLRR